MYCGRDIGAGTCVCPRCRGEAVPSRVQISPSIWGHGNPPCSGLSRGGLDLGAREVACRQLGILVFSGGVRSGVCLWGRVGVGVEIVDRVWVER